MQGGRSLALFQKGPWAWQFSERNPSFSAIDGDGANQVRLWRWICFEKYNGLYWHKILIIDKINKAIMSLFVEVLLPGTCWPRGVAPAAMVFDSQASPGELLGHPASPCFFPLVLSI